MLLEARGKINWVLKVLGKRPDGYHLLDMLMQPITLCDDVIVEPAPSLTLTTSGAPTIKPDETNLAWKAAIALQEAAGIRLGAKLHVHKRIPIGAGMGGGSANAAAALMGLNRLWGLYLSTEELCRIGLTIGADVPFCIRGGLMRVGGIGEIMTPIPCDRHYWLVIVQPCRGLSTRAVFQRYTCPDMGEDANQLLPAIQAIQRADFEQMRIHLTNDLQPVSAEMRPRIARAVEQLYAHGAAFAMMTGSGSAVFGVFRSAMEARKAESLLKQAFRITHMVHTCQESVKIIDPG